MTRRILIALVLAVSIVAPPALGRAADMPIPFGPRIGTLRTAYVRSFKVDGLPVMSPEQQVWTGILWAPLGSDDSIRALRRLGPIGFPRE